LAICDLLNSTYNQQQTTNNKQLMIILFFGDVVGAIGRSGLAKILPELRKKYSPDFVLANVENLAHHKGVTTKTLRELANLGLDGFTGGNHIWTKEDPAIAAKNASAILVTPANDERTVASQRLQVLISKTGGEKLAIANLVGRVFMVEESKVSCPFHEADILLQTKIDAPLIIDMHAETTAEKAALGWYLDGRVAGVLGTHTHIQTADERILPEGAAYITDLGMVGAKDSVLGITKELIIEKFLTDGPIIFESPEEGEVGVNGVLLTIDPKTKKATALERICETVII